MTLLDTINSREALCALNDAQLRQLCDEIRQFLVLNVARTGGHLASNLGVVELSVALERYSIRAATGSCSTWGISPMSTRS